MIPLADADSHFFNRKLTAMTTIGERIRQLRKQSNLTQRELARQVGMNFTYLSRIENDRLEADQTPREDTLKSIASALSADADELLLLARRIPESISNRILHNPSIFKKVLSLSDTELEDLLKDVGRE